MATTAIELNDVGVLAVREGETVMESPGVALVDGGAVQTGSQASANARIKPRSVANRFWDSLSLETPAGVTGDRHSHADLAYLHLDAIRREIGGDEDEFLLCVPGSFTRQQLGLLLGIARECSMNVVGLVDSAVAACEQAAGSGRVLYLDAQLHRIVLTELEAGRSLSRSGVYEINRFGLLALREAWAEAIADTFVKNTRYDPMHLAGSEQELYDRLPDWLFELHDNPQAPFSLGAAGRQHTVSLKPERLAAATADFYQQIVQLISGRMRPGDQATLLLSHRLGAFPGFLDLLGQLSDAPVTELDAGQSARGALRHLEFLRSSGDALSFVTSLPLARGRATLTAPSDTGPAFSGLTPTHIVHGARVYALGESPLVVGSAVPDGVAGISVRGPAPGVSRQHFALHAEGGGVVLKDQSTYGTFVNGQRVEGSARVKAGDTITIGSPAQSLALVAEGGVNGA